MSASRVLQDYIFTSKYARYIPEKKRRETWGEAVDRVRNMMLTQYKDCGIDDKINWAYDLMRKKRVLGSQRALQFGGDPVFKKNARVYNCTSSYVDRPRFFQEYFWLLLCGCGCGFSVQKHHVVKLPNLRKNNNDRPTKTFTIPDTIEGWADAAGILLTTYWDTPASPEFKEWVGCNVKFSYRKIRPKGSYLSSGVGKAPGPDGLRYALDTIRVLLDRCISDKQKKLRPIDAYDVCMHLSDAVLSGGVRRSSSIAIFSPDDIEMAMAKTSNWLQENPQRARSNNSALLIRNKTDKQQFKDLMVFVKEFGEPGFIWADSPEFLMNPCGEISLFGYDVVDQDKFDTWKKRDPNAAIKGDPSKMGLESGWQGCVSKDTKLITKNGIETIGETIGQNIEIWNGNKWSIVTPVQTGSNRTLYRVYISDGSHLDCTKNHRWIVNINGKESIMETEKIAKYIQTHKSKVRLKRPNITQDFNGENIEYAYEYGFVLGDGTARKNHSPSAQLFKDDTKLKLRGSITGPHTDNKHSIPYHRIHFVDLNNEFSYILKYEEGLPKNIFEWSKNSILKFFAGWIDADGCSANNGCRLYGRKDKLKDAQLLLTKVGINSSLNLMSDSGTITNKGKRKHAIWYLQIPNAKYIPSRRLNLSNGKDPVAKAKYQIIKEIKKLPGLHDSYCFKEQQLGQGVFNNVLTKQCNLTTTNCSKLVGETIEEKTSYYLENIEAAAIIGTLQAGFTKFDYLTPASEKIFKREALLGVSMTGMMDNFDIVLDPNIQTEAAKLVLKTNKTIAKAIGINLCARGTCLKPEGTGTLVLGSSAHGCHPHHYIRYLRVVQANTSENVYQHFKKYNAQACEPSHWSTNNTDDVVFFPIEVPDGAKTKNQLPAIELLKIVRSTQRNWVSKGKRPNLCVMPWLSHNVSNTITVGPDEWKEVQDFIFDNRKHFAGITLVPDSADKDYVQAPNCAVYTSRQIVREYGEAALWTSGLIELGLEAFDGNLWDACTAVLNPSYTQDKWAPGKTSKRAVFWKKCHKFAEKYFDSDVKKLTYCMKDVFNRKRWLDLSRTLVEVDYTKLIETEDNTELRENVGCVGGSCLLFS